MSDTARPILLAGRFGFGDLGDDAVLEGVVAEIRRRDPTAAIAAVSGDPAPARRLAIEAVDASDIAAIDRAVARSRRVLFGLGGVFEEDPGTPADLFREGPVGAEACARIALLAALRGIPSALFAAGVSPRPPEAARLFALACANADALVVRDEASAEAARSCGVLTPVSVGADAAYLREPGPSDSDEAAGILSARGLSDAPWVAFALRAGPSDAESIDLAARAAAGLPPGWAAVFLPFRRRTGDGDRNLAARAADACGPRGVVLEAGTPGQLVGLLARARAVVAMGRHAVILAASTGTPAVSLLDDPGAAEASRLGLEAWSVARADGARLGSALGEAASSDDGRRTRLAAAARATRYEAAAAFDSIEPSAEDLATRPPAAPDDLPKALERLAAKAARVDRSLAGELAEAAARSRTERERWLAELIRVRGACWDSKSQAELAAGHAQIWAGALQERVLALEKVEKELLEQRNAARHHRSLLERQLLEARVEIMRFQGSRLWRSANVYWNLRKRLGLGRSAEAKPPHLVYAAATIPAPAPVESPPAPAAATEEARTDAPVSAEAAAVAPAEVSPAEEESQATSPGEAPVDPAPPPPDAAASRNGLVGPPLPVHLPGPFGMHAVGGRCLVCGRETDFVYDDPAAWREQLACLLCRTTSRYRSIARGLLDGIRALTGLEAASVAELPREKPGGRLSIYDTQTPFTHMASAYPIPDLLARCSWIDLEMSTWKRRKKLGRRLGPRTTNQNLERLTFPDASFDIVVTSDVMEHVRLEDRAHREIRRVLKPGGIYIFTVPYERDRPTIVRVEMPDPDDPRKDRHIHAPEYHGDANDPDGQALAYRNFGIDLERSLEALGFEVSYHRSDLERFGILGTELFFCRLRD